VATPRSADSVGRVLRDRYRLIRLLGVGASAHVYVAEDVELRRRVAIKLLHPALVADQGFLRRFRAEAQVVAALRHPNILRIYDWGEDGGAPYLVMELLVGGSLRAMLDRGHILTPAQAAAVGANAARALDYAHRRSLVHRDIKPANLIFDDEGRLTVADFGLARALAEATLTEPTGAVVGTARYAAPEQARGELLDHRADVYALALVLVEATTGTVPFAADTTLGTLMARLDRPITIPEGHDLGPLGPVLEAAGTVSPRDRMDAADLALALDGVATWLPPPPPLPLADPLSDWAAERDSSPTDYPGRTRLFDGADSEDGVDVRTERPLDGETEELTVLASAVPDLSVDHDGIAFADADRSPEPAEAGPGSAPSGPARAGPAPAQNRVAPPARPFLPDEADRPRRRWRRRLLMALVVVVILALGAGGAVYAIQNRHQPSYLVPSLAGQTQAAATASLLPVHLKLAVTSRVYSAQVPAGHVIAQTPAHGASLHRGHLVGVTLSLGPQPVPAPSLANDTQTVATSVLHTLGLVASPVTYKTSMTVPAGSVINSSPDTGTIVPGSSVALVVSQGKPKVAVPALSVAQQASLATAQAALAAVGLGVSDDAQYSDTVPSGQVMSTTPPAGTSVTVGTTITVVVSKGPHLATIPTALVGGSVGAATTTLGSLGFQVSGVDGNPLGTVTGTDPAAGTTIDYGSPVQIVTG
jgi:serine/threonine-protein kinase